MTFYGFYLARKSDSNGMCALCVCVICEPSRKLKNEEFFFGRRCCYCVIVDNATPCTREALLMFTSLLAIFFFSFTQRCCCCCPFLLYSFFSERFERGKKRNTRTCTVNGARVYRMISTHRIHLHNHTHAFPDTTNGGR